MTQKPLDISTLVGSRICHDLISPLGAIANGVELMNLSGVPQTPEMALIAQSVENANARIKMFRIAYGSAGADQQISAGEVRAIMSGLSNGGRVNYSWTLDSDALRRHVRFAMLLIQAMETAMPYGGNITTAENNGKWTIEGRADRLAYDPNLWAYIEAAEGGDHPLAASHVHFQLIDQLRRDHGYQLGCVFGDTQVTLTF